MQVGVIGLGRVGDSMRRFLEQRVDVVTYDAATDQRYPDAELAKCEFAVICVDTPMRHDGSCDTSKVAEAAQRVPTHLVLVRSTVAPGTTDRLVVQTGKQVCCSPEYVTDASHADPGWAEVFEPPFVILGATPETRRDFASLLVPLFGPEKTYFQCTALEAEITKYMENAYLATKVSFVNEFFEICKALGADWHTVREGWLLDPRIGRSHSAVFEAARGFGGRCLVKDLHAIVAAATSAGYEPGLLEAVLHQNEVFRTEAAADPK
jgi:nucleotide sugar dehydrogenase